VATFDDLINPGIVGNKSCEIIKGSPELAEISPGIFLFDLRHRMDTDKAGTF
jgi:hypothetical protein